MDSQKLVPEGVAIFISILIPCSFVIFVDFTKKLAASKLIRNRGDKTGENRDDYNSAIEYELREKTSYREAELKFFLPYSFVYLLIVILFFLFIGSYINFDIKEIYFSSKYNKSVSSKILGTFTILIINFILYSGLLIQFFMGNEKLYPKTPFLYFMENLYGPFLEEFIYRGLLFTLVRHAGYGGIVSSILSSITFSLSHFRHVFDIYFTKRMIPHLIFQSFYTLLFGFYTCYAYNYSGTIFAPILLHATCNTLQMPRLYYLNDSSVSKFQKHLISITYIVGILLWIILIKIFH